MSYSIFLVIDTGGPEPACVSDGWNCTSNVAPMWRAAGVNLAEHHGQHAGVVAHGLAAAIRALEADPATFEAMNPANGWGDYTGCVDALKQLLHQYQAHPLATVQVHR